MKKNTYQDKIKAARTAFAAYERAVAAANEVIAAGPVRGLGTTVMTGSKSSFNNSFTCSECQGRGKGDWKFCAFCGAEIVRFELPKESNTISVQVESAPAEPRTQTVFVQTYKEPKSKTARA